MTLFLQTQFVPPSVNACYSNVRGKGRARTKRYNIWKNAASQQLKGPESIKGPFTAVITIDRIKRRANADIDNRIKPTLDILQSLGRVENDNLCESVTARWGEAEGGMSIRIEPFLLNRSETHNEGQEQ